MAFPGRGCQRKQRKRSTSKSKSRKPLPASKIWLWDSPKNSDISSIMPGSSNLRKDPITSKSFRCSGRRLWGKDSISTSCTTGYLKSKHSRHDWPQISNNSSRTFYSSDRKSNRRPKILKMTTDTKETTNTWRVQITAKLGSVSRRQSGEWAISEMLEIATLPIRNRQTLPRNPLCKWIRHWSQILRSFGYHRWTRFKGLTHRTTMVSIKICIKIPTHRTLPISKSA